MRRTRMFGAAVSVAALLGAAAATGGPASAATSGVGTTKASTTALSVSLGNNGSLLNLRLAGDDGSANIDPKVATPSTAASSLSPLTSTSAIQALNVSLPKVSVSSTGAADNKTVPSITFPSAAAPVAAGSIAPLSLSAVVDAANGAASGLNSTLSNLNLVSGLISIPSANSSLGAAAKSGDADGLRGASIPSIQVLNLGAVLQGLGVNPANLTVGQLGSALSGLGITLPNGTGSLTGAQLGSLGSELNTLSAATGSSLLSSLPVDPTSTINGLLPAATPLPATPKVSDAVTAITTQLQSLLPTALTDIANAPLLQVDNLVVGLTTKAADTVQNSASDIQASIGDIKVGTLTIPGADLLSVVTSAQNTINGVLQSVGLTNNLISVKALDESKSVSATNGYTNAVANLTGLHVAIAPLAGLTGAAATAQVAPADAVGSLLTTVPALSSAMATLNGLTGMPAAGALTQGASVDVLQVGASSAFLPGGSSPANPSAATPANGTLAVTGGPTQILGIVGLLLLATVAGLRWLRRPATTH